MAATMSDEFKIQAEWLEGLDGEIEERASFGEIGISAADQVLTELEDRFAKTVRQSVRASAYDMALWFVANWWRLRWETEAKSVTDWQLSHNLAAAGGGFAWPNILFVSDGSHVHIESRRTKPSPVSPIAYLSHKDIVIRASALEAGIDQFVEGVLSRLAAITKNQSPLATLWNQLDSERRDPDLGPYRRLEARLGFDPGDVPPELVDSLLENVAEAGRDSVEEIAAAAKEKAPGLLRDMLAQTRRSGIHMSLNSFEQIVKSCDTSSFEADLPWKRATSAARIARQVWGIGEGPISNETLSDLFEVQRGYLENPAVKTSPIAAGLRADDSVDSVKVVMRGKYGTGRRFELMRLVGDCIAAPHPDRLLPATTAKTDRQKFQRAFAQEFLLPFEEVQQRIAEQKPGTDISEDDVDEIAQAYDVSPLVVQTLLVNKAYLARENLTWAS